MSLRVLILKYQKIQNVINQGLAIHMVECQ
ncbi:hypothetical protein MTR67_031707 [Solanum verrucosum]|uniref:Uncharacterized protein n=1 Tax=Solanum verrucosum TaxID=315347 RepID=A0AAF0U320_SOLVR|nr:hypothetical protein MTR67_031707 [Solanum verrucosum]